MSEEESGRNRLETQSEGEEKRLLYHEITESLQGIFESADHLYAGLDKGYCVVFVGNNKEERTNPGLHIGAMIQKMDGKARSLELSLLGRLPDERSLQPHFETNLGMRGRAIQNLRIDGILLKPEDQNLDIDIGVLTPTVTGEKTFVLKYQLTSGGKLSRREISRTDPIKMSTEEMPRVLEAVEGYLKRIQETLGEQEAQEQARKKGFV